MKFVSVVLFCLVVVAKCQQRIAMGTDPNCDPGDDHYGVDWDQNNYTEYTCNNREHLSPTNNSYINCQPIEYPWHICMHQKIFYKSNPPLSGSHRPSWPRYGEYVYVPPQRYIHSLEHGAAVFLYHPCADKNEIEKFKKMAKQCLYRHIISPSRLMNSRYPFAILTWGCMLSMGRVDELIARHYIKRYAIKRAPEAHVYTDGQYSRGLTYVAEIVSNQADTLLCPSVAEKRQYFNAHSQQQQRYYQPQNRYYQRPQQGGHYRPSNNYYQQNRYVYQSRNNNELRN